jgi:predicted dehydrogenase
MQGALIGCGFFAQNHLNAWRDMRADGVELAAVCDVDEGKARAAAEKFGIPDFYTDAAKMLQSEKLDFVDIATRMESHLALVRLAASAKVAAIVQKPLAPDWDEAVAIVRTARDAGIRLAIHENFRFQAPMLKLRKLLNEGVIGRPTWGRFAFRTHFDVYRTQPYFHAEKRLAILDVGVHILDLARVFLGEVERISCETQRRNAKNVGEDTATMLLRHVSGAVSVAECTYEARVDPDPFPETLISLEGDEGSLAVDAGRKGRLFRGGRTENFDLDSPVLSWTSHPWHTAQESVLATQRAIISAWAAGGEAETRGEDNLKTFALVEAAYDSARDGRAYAPRTAPS